MSDYWEFKPASIMWIHKSPQTTEKAPACPVTYRALTLGEFRAVFNTEPTDEWWFENAGKTLIEDPMPMSRPDPGFKAMLLGSESLLIADDLVVVESYHSFVQSGCRKSWCSVCDHEGLFDFESGTFKPV